MAIRGAESGDLVSIEITDVDFRTTYGVNSFDAGSGVLGDQFSALDIEVIRLDVGDSKAKPARGLELPLAPFFGIMAVAPSSNQGRVSAKAPGRFGGNLDIKEFVPGSRLYLPVQAPGGLIYVGDGHAAQGDGEVNSTAIETSLTGEFVLRLHKNIPGIAWPIGETPASYIPIELGDSLDGALQHAVDQSVDF